MFRAALKHYNFYYAQLNLEREKAIYVDQLCGVENSSGNTFRRLMAD